MSTENNKRESKGLTTLGRLAGAVGLVLIASSPFTFFLTGFGVLVLSKIILGAILVALYLGTNADVWSRLAGARSTGLLAMTAVSIVVVLGVVGVVNFVAYKNPKQFDLTREGLFTLSEQTTKLLGNLKQDVRVYAFFARHEQGYQTVEETLTRYKQASPKFTFEMVDPQARVDLVEKFKITERGPRLVITAGEQDARAKEPSEEELTNAIIKVAEQTNKTIYFLTGHGEPNLADKDNAEGYKAVAEAITAEGYNVEPLSLIKAGEAKPGDKVDTKAAPDKSGADGLQVPPSASVVIVAGPKSALFAPEVAALENYLMKGGRLVVMLDPESDGGLANLLKQWHVELDKDIVVDTNPLNRLLGLGPAAPMVQPVEAAQEHPVVKALTAPAIFVAARSLKMAAGGQPGVQAEALLESGESAWGETNLVDGAASFDDKDVAGPLPMAFVATKPVGDLDKRSDEGRLLALGNSAFINNKYLHVQANSDLFVNAINWLAEEQQRIAIHAKARSSSQLFLSGEQMDQIKFFSLDILPVLIIAMGLGIVLVRRQR
jgi:ABC-type uncharacterized transport system involved in gliding motility auxiliary subunit